MDTARYIEKITTLFGRMLAQTELDAEAESLGLTHSQIAGLGYLLHHKQSSIGDLAQGLGTTHPAVIKLVDRLRKKGLVERAEDISDRRVSLVELTKRGREIAERAVSKRTEALARLLSGMSSQELEDVMRGIETLAATALEARGGTDSVCLHCGDDHIGCCVVNRTHLELTGSNIDTV